MITMDKADEITLRRKYFKPSALGFVTVIRKSFFSIATTFFQHYLKFIYLGEQLPMFRTPNQSLMLMIHRKLNNEMTL